MNLGSFCYKTKLVNILLKYEENETAAQWIKCTKKDLPLCALQQK